MISFHRAHDMAHGGRKIFGCSFFARTGTLNFQRFKNEKYTCVALGRGVLRGSLSRNSDLGKAKLE